MRLPPSHAKCRPAPARQCFLPARPIVLALQSLKFAIHSSAFAFVRPELSFVGDARPPIGDLISLVSERLASWELSLVVRERVLTLVEFAHGHRHRRQPPLLPPSLVEPSACGAGTARCCWAARRIEPGC